MAIAHGGGRAARRKLHGAAEAAAPVFPDVGHFGPQVCLREQFTDASIFDPIILLNARASICFAQDAGIRGPFPWMLYLMSFA
jgi:hypothetical protein